MNKQIEIIESMTKDEAESWQVEVETTGQRLGQLLYEGYKRDAWRVLGYGSWTQCVKSLSERSGFSWRRGLQLLENERLNQDVLHEVPVLNHGSIQQNRVPERQTRPLSKLPTDNEKREVWQEAIETAPDGKVTAKHVEEVVTEHLGLNEEDEDELPPLLYDGYSFAYCKYCYETHDRWDLSGDHDPDAWECRNCAHFTADHNMVIGEDAKDEKGASLELSITKPKAKDYITLNEWNEMGNVERCDILQMEGSSSFNRTNDNIEWARWSWNPITGCLHNCAYCYARDIASRFFPQNFEPSFLPIRLNAPDSTKQPDFDKITDPVERMGQRNVFVCSMADLFGKWVPEEWIIAVLESITRNPQWTFLLLTKFPVRMAEFSYPDNVWLGTTVDYQYAVKRAESAFIKVKASGFGGICWLSCEPMMENLQFNSLDMFDWVVMGGSSRSSQTPEFRPPFDWIVNLYNQARQSDCRIYQKTNLIPGISDIQRVREYPE